MANRMAGGPGGPRGGRGMPRAKADENTGKNLKRLLKLTFENYKIQAFFVVVGIAVSAICGVRGTLFIKTLIDSYITPLLQSKTPDYTGLKIALFKMAGIYALGIFANFLYNYLMMFITQGTLKRMRDDMFTHMQTLPIKYFDGHTHGELMSRYTNDVDTLRQMISQTVPQLLNSSVTIISVLISMFMLSWQLTIIALAIVALMLTLSTKVGGASGKYFVKQQKDLGRLNGYIEEMMDGQKVVKVFTHEEKAKEEFDALNETLCESMRKANGFANIMGPISGNLGHLNFSVTAIVGSVMAKIGRASCRERV